MLRVPQPPAKFIASTQHLGSSYGKRGPGPLERGNQGGKRGSGLIQGAQRTHIRQPSLDGSPARTGTTLQHGRPGQRRPTEPGNHT